MSIRNRFARWLLAGETSRAGAPLRRAFDASKVDDLSYGFSAAGANVAIDQDILMALERVRGRSRNLAQNNDFAKRYLQLAVNNIVGPCGFTLQCQAQEGARADDIANRMIEASFAQWAARGVCDVGGTLSFVDICRMNVESWKRDGEFLTKRVRGKAAKNKWGYALQVLDVDRLPVQYQGGQSGGNSIVMGVEINDAGRPVAYHLSPRHPGSTVGWTQSTAGRLDRVAANDLFHGFRAQRPEQRRGIPAMHTAMLRMEMLGKFEAAAMVAARRGAETLGFFVSPDGQAPTLDGTGADGNPISTSVPGTYDTLPQGFDFKPHESKYPTDVYGHFVKWSVRSIASGLGVSYNGLANDLENVNYSSIRAGLLDERDGWMSDQDWFIEAFLRPVFLDWLEMSLLSGAIVYPQGSALPAAKIEKFSAHAWQARRWAWVDPMKDVLAQLISVRGNLKSRREVMAEQGRDINDVWAQLAAEKAEAAVLGLLLDNEIPATTSAAVAAQAAAQAGTS